MKLNFHSAVFQFHRNVTLRASALVKWELLHSAWHTMFHHLHLTFCFLPPQYSQPVSQSPLLTHSTSALKAKILPWLVSSVDLSWINMTLFPNFGPSEIRVTSTVLWESISAMSQRGRCITKHLGVEIPPPGNKQAIMGWICGLITMEHFMPPWQILHCRTVGPTAALW